MYCGSSNGLGATSLRGRGGVQPAPVAGANTSRDRSGAAAAPYRHPDLEALLCRAEADALNGRLAEARTTHAALLAELEATKEKLRLEGEQRRKADEDYTVSLEEQRVEFFKTRMEAIVPDLIAAMNTLGQTEFATKLSTATA
jgi:hypothetical protein